MRTLTSWLFNCLLFSLDTILRTLHSLHGSHTSTGNTKDTMSGDSFEPGVAISSLSSDTAVSPAITHTSLPALKPIQIQLILADVPLFAVGILAFGVLMFFFLMKRVDK